MVRILSMAALALLVLALTLAACSSFNAGKKIAASVTKQYQAVGAVCTKDGKVLFPREGGHWVYDCLIRGADPDLLYAERIETSPFRRCFVYYRDAVDVTSFLRERHISGASPKRFPCLNDDPP
jgi:hypothetical protein